MLAINQSQQSPETHFYALKIPNVIVTSHFTYWLSTAKFVSAYEELITNWFSDQFGKAVNC